MFTQYFRNNWHTRDIRADRGVPLLLSGASVVIDQDFLTPDEMRLDPMYNELFAPLDFQWFAGVGFRAGSALWGLTIQRTVQDGPFEQRDKRLLSVLSQRLTEVATLATAVGRTALTSATNALNCVRQPAIAIDRFGFVLDANRLAHDLFDNRIQIKNKRLFLADAQARSSFEKLLSRLRITPDTAALPCDPIVVPREEGGPVIVRTLPVHGAARTPFLGARALLTFSVVGPKAGPTAELLARVFGLTPAEARLASIMAEGANLEQAADQLEVSRETARSQLKAVFAKTRTNRQSKLVALLSQI
jgi:DNA-binding CsgD family transcriptional regulator